MSASARVGLGRGLGYERTPPHHHLRLQRRALDLLRAEGDAHPYARRSGGGGGGRALDALGCTQLVEQAVHLHPKGARAWALLAKARSHEIATSPLPPPPCPLRRQDVLLLSATSAACRP